MKKIMVLMLVIISMVIFAGCGNDNKKSSSQQEQQTPQNVELDMMLAQFRPEKKMRELETGVASVSPEDFRRFPGQSQNIPNVIFHMMMRLQGQEFGLITLEINIMGLTP